MAHAHSFPLRQFPGSRMGARRVLMMIGVVAVVAAIGVVWSRSPSPAALSPTCAEQDQVAATLIKPLLEDASTAGLRNLDDAVRSLISARQRCFYGWSNLAGQTYTRLIDRLSVRH